MWLFSNSHWSKIVICQKSSENPPRTLSVCHSVYGLFYRWIGPPVHAHKKINLPANQKGYVRQFRDHDWKALSKENPNLLWLCLETQFWPPFQKWLSNLCPNKNNQSRFRFAPSNTLVPGSQILLRCLGLMACDGKLIFSQLRKSTWYACTK